MAPSIQDLAIEPSENSSTFLHGFLGVTPELTVSGIVKFTAAKSVNVTALTIKLQGLESVRFTLPQETDKPLTASKSLINLSIKLLDPSESSSSGSSSSKKAPSVSLKQGEHEYPFSFKLSEQITATLPNSMWFEKNNDSAKVVYTLTADIDLAPSMFGSAKSESVVEYVDFPRLNVPNIVRAQAMDTTATVEGSTDTISYKASAFPNIFGVNQPVTFTLDQAYSNTRSHNITGINVAIRQDIILKSSDGTKSKTVSYTIAKPEVKGKFTTKAGTFPKPVSVALPSASALLAPRESPAVASVGSGNATVASAPRSRSPSPSGIIMWHGQVDAVVAGTHVRDRRDRKAGAVDAFSATTFTELVSVRHAFELIVTSKEHGEERVSVPAIFMDVDQETRDWVLRNHKALSSRREE